MINKQAKLILTYDAPDPNVLPCHMFIFCLLIPVYRLSWLILPIPFLGPLLSIQCGLFLEHSDFIGFQYVGVSKHTVQIYLINSESS